MSIFDLRKLIEVHDEVCGNTFIPICWNAHTIMLCDLFRSKVSLSGSAVWLCGVCVCVCGEGGGFFVVETLASISIFFVFIRKFC